ncbi:MAG TPA: transcriptional regulator [Acidimicrobiaceae bacterium]|nr:transcriptional regulator [Acidimicrobiaceae bacterium]
MDLDDAARKQLESLGGFIRERRKQAQYSLRDLADRANVSNPYLSQIERGLHTPSVRVLKAIAAALNVSAESLLVQAGLLEASDDGEQGPSVEDAIRADALLSEDQKAAMLAVYRSYVARNTAEDD